MTALLLGCGAGAAVATAILVAGGADRIDVLLLALAGSLPFFDVARRSFAGIERGTGDFTDLGMASAFAAILVAAAWDRRGETVALEGWLVAAGLLLIAVGCALRIWAVRAMGREFRMRLDVRADQRLVVGGPFRAIRHPNYAGLSLVALGTAAALESACALLVALGIWLPTMLFRIAREERLLAGRFGDAWQAYRRRTSRLIPGVY